MSDPSTALLITMVGIWALLVGFVAITFRLGRFVLLPGESRRLVGLAGFGLAVSLAMPFVATALDGGIAPIAIVVTLGLLAYSFVALNRRNESTRQDTAQVAELERRRLFMRTGGFIVLVIGFVAVGTIWAMATVLLLR